MLTEEYMKKAMGTVVQIVSGRKIIQGKLKGFRLQYYELENCTTSDGQIHYRMLVFAPAIDAIRFSHEISFSDEEVDFYMYLVYPSKYYIRGFY